LQVDARDGYSLGMVEKEQPPPVPFRFLNHEEFGALSQAERIKYLQLAIEAVKSGAPMQTTPIKDKR
jgi:hypothetical protein